MPDTGPDTITVPGAIRGWEALHRQGAALPWRRAFDAAADVADGFPVSRDLAWSLARRCRHPPRGPGDRRRLLRARAPDRRRHASRNRHWRARSGSSRTRDPTPSTPVSSGAGSSTASVRSARTLSAEDLASHAADLLPPLRGRYRDLDVSVTPPGSQGFVLLEALAAVERLGIDPDPTGPDAATLARVLMAASADRDRHLADPGSMRVHVSSLLDEGHIAALCDIARGRLEDHAPAVPEGPSGDTIALVAADADGWGVSLIESLFSAWGAGFLEPATGIIAHDRGACFTLEPQHPNELAPGKRPAHTLMPVAVHRGGRLAGLDRHAGRPRPAADRPDDAGPCLRPRPGPLRGRGRTPVAGRRDVAAPRAARGSRPRGRSPRASGPTSPRRASRSATLDDVDRAVGHAMLLRIDGRTLLAGSDPRADGGARSSVTRLSAHWHPRGHLAD